MKWLTGFASWPLTVSSILNIPYTLYWAKSNKLLGTLCFVMVKKLGMQIVGLAEVGSNSLSQTGALVVRTWQRKSGLPVQLVRLIFVTASHQTGLDTRSISHKSIIVEIEGRGRSCRSRDSSTAGLCWLSTHFVQYGPDEPTWTWTQIWVQARMPDLWYLSLPPTRQNLTQDQWPVGRL